MELKQLKNLKTLRAVLDNCTEQEVDSIIENLSSVKQEIHCREEKAKEEEIRERAVMMEILETLKNSNLTVDKLVSFSKELSDSKKIDGRSTPSPKYRYTDLNGIERTWTGRGRVPVQMLEVMEKEGHDKDYYLI